MTVFPALVAGASPTAPPPAEDLGRLLLWVAVPAVILATIVAAFIKRAVLSSPQFRDRRPACFFPVARLGFSEVP